MKPISLKGLKEKCWKLFSEIRRREYADKNGYVKCVCCGASHLWNSGDIHAGHYIHAGTRKRVNNAVSYDKRNIFPQCFSCNKFDKDNAKHKFSTFVRELYGPGIDEELRAIKSQSDLKREDFERMIEQFKKELEKLP